MAQGIADFLLRVRADTKDAENKLGRLRSQSHSTGNALSKMATIAGGFLLRDVILGGVRALRTLGTEALNATRIMQNLQIQMESLAARELKNAGNAMMEFAEEQGYHNALTGETLVGLEAFQTQLDSLGISLDVIGDRFRVVNRDGQQFVAITDEQAASLYSASDMMGFAQERASTMIAELRRIAIISPYTVQATNQLFKLAQAYGFNARESLMMTEGMLNLAAGIGATTEQTERMMFNFAQIRMQGKIMSRDFWELGKAGFDLNAVLEELSQTTGQVIDDHLDFNRLIADGTITWEQFAEAFASMAEKDFAGAAEKMAYSITGIMSTIQDIFNLTVPDLFMPAAEVFGAWVQDLAGVFLDTLESGFLSDIGEDLAGIMEGALGLAFGFVMPTDLPEIGTMEHRLGIYGEEAGDSYSDGFLGRLASSLTELTGFFDVLGLGGFDAAGGFLEMKGFLDSDQAEVFADFGNAFVHFADALSGLAVDTLILLKDTLLGFFEAVTPENVSIIGLLTSAMEGIATFIDEHPNLPTFILSLGTAFLAFKAVSGVIGVFMGLGFSLLQIAQAMSGLLLVGIALNILKTVIDEFGEEALLAFQQLIALGLMGFFSGLSARADALSGVLSTAIGWFSGLGEKLAEIAELTGSSFFGNMADAINNFLIPALEGVVDWLGRMAENFMELVARIPSWLVPGSPPPLAEGFGYIGTELRRVNRGFSTFSREARGLGNSAFGASQMTDSPSMFNETQRQSSSTFDGATINIQNPTDKQWLLRTFRRT